MTRARGKTAARGYSGRHAQLRTQWAPVVAAGRAYCHATTCLELTRWIDPSAPWDLGHTPDRTGWTGPEHRKCNRSDGARRGNRVRGSRTRRVVTTTRAALRTSRNW